MTPSKTKLVALVAGLVIVGVVVAITVVKARDRDHGFDMVDLENAQLENVRDEVCACKDEACLHEPVMSIGEIRQRREASGQTPSDEQHAQTLKTMDAIGACVDRASSSSSSSSSAATPDLVAEMAAIRDAMCACKDAACAAKVIPRVDAWRDKYLPTFKAHPDDVRRRAIEVTTANKVCMDRLTSDPGAPSPAVFAGSYDTSEGAMTLVQKAAHPDVVTGTYAKGTLACAASGNELACAWTERTSAGHAHFKRAANGDMAGTWGLGAASRGGGAWTCTLLTPGVLLR